MYDTAKRVELVKKRVRENRRRNERHSIYGLSALCVFLFAALAGMAGTVIGQTQTATHGLFGAMLLHENAGGYVLVGVVSFAMAVTITVLCIRHRFKWRKEDEKTII